MIKKTLLGVFVFLIFSCVKYSPQFLEEKPFTDKITPIYFSRTIDSASDIFVIDENFRKQPITIKDRSSFPKYSKIYFDEDFFPVKVENYKRDLFNNHIYYPYFILKVEKAEGKVAVAVTEKTWQNGQLITSSVKMNFFDRQTEGNLASLVETLKKNGDSTLFLNQIFTISFIADDNPENRDIQNRLAGNIAFVKMGGKEVQNPDMKVNLFFFAQTQPDVTFIPINHPVFVRVRFSKYSPEEGIDFTYLGFDIEKNKAMVEQEQKAKEDAAKQSGDSDKNKDNQNKNQSK